MKCPVCREADLVMSERNGIEIDYCPTCRGVWLDRGELDKIIDRATPTAAQPTQQAPQTRPQPYSSHGHHDAGYGYGKKKKREGFLGELFDDFAHRQQGLAAEFVIGRRGVEVGLDFFRC